LCLVDFINEHFEDHAEAVLVAPSQHFEQDSIDPFKHLLLLLELLEVEDKAVHQCASIKGN